MRALLLCLLLSLSVAKSFSISNRPLSRFHNAIAPSLIQTQHHRTTTVSHHVSALTKANKFRGGSDLTSTSSSMSADAVASPGDDEDKSSKKSKYSQKLTNILTKVKAAPFALAVASLMIGYKIGAKSVSETASKAASSGSARSAARQYPIVAVLLFVIAVRDTWSLIPEWAKKNIPFVGNKDKSVDDVDPDDLTSIPAIALKLRKLFQRGKEKLSSQDGADIENPGFVFLALIRMMDLLKQQLAPARDKSYDDSGTVVDNPKDVLDGMDEYFEYADWAYNEFKEGDSLKECLAAKGYSLLRHETKALPGHVAHYVAVSPDRKEALIGIKGTSNFEDMLTDCCGNSVQHEFKDGPFVDGGREEISCHEGVLLSSKRLADDLQTFVESVLLPSGYKLKVVGHSLGAGVGVIFSMILRSRIKVLREDKGTKLKVLAFASPPILDYEASVNCQDFVCTYVNNADIVPRSSLSNLAILMDQMKTVNKRLDEEDLSPRGIKSTAKFIKRLAKGNKEETIMSAEQIQESITNALEKIDIEDSDHLYVAGKVVHMYDQWTKDGYGNKSEYEGEEDKSKIVDTAEKVYTADGSAKALRVIEIDDRMMTDHMSAAYRASFRSMLDKSKEVSDPGGPQMPPEDETSEADGTDE